MANLTIVSAGANSIDVAFGVYATNMGRLNGSYDNRDVMDIALSDDSSHVLVQMRKNSPVVLWLLTWDTTYGGSEYFIVDLVDAAAPTSQADLYTKIQALRG